MSSSFLCHVFAFSRSRVFCPKTRSFCPKSKCSICILAALGRDNALKLNLEMVLNNGAKLQEIFEALFQVAAYAGFPVAWDALVKLEEVLDEIDR